MAEDSRAASVDEGSPVVGRSESGKRLLDGDERKTGFSSSAPPGPPPPPPSEAGEEHGSSLSVAVAASAIEVVKQRAEQIVARLVVASQDAKRSRMDQDGAAHDQSAPEPAAAKALQSSSDILRNGNSQGGMHGLGYYNTSAAMQIHKIDIPNGKVGVVIGKGGETIRHLQQQSGARIQITKDADHDPYAQTRQVELMGTSEQVTHAEQLINNVIIETDAGASGIAVARGASSGGEQIQIGIPNNKVGLIIGRGGETIKSLQVRSGARIQLVPLEAPGETLPGPILERMLSLAGTKQQIDSASAMVKQILDQSNTRAPPFSGSYNSQGTHPPTGGPQWGQPRGPPAQQSTNNHQQAGNNNGYQQMQATQQYAVSQPPSNSYSQQQSLGYNNQPTSYQAGGYNNQQSSLSGTLSTGTSQTQDGGLVPSLPFNNQQANYSQQVSTQLSMDSQGYMQPQAYVLQNTQNYGLVQSHPNYNMNGQQSSVAEGYSTQQGTLPPNYVQYPQAYSQQIALASSQVYLQQGNASSGYDQQGYGQQPAASQQLVYGQQGLNQQAYGMPPSNYAQQTMVPTQMYAPQGLTQQVYAMPGESSQQQSYMQQAYVQPGASQPSINGTADGSSQQQIANQAGNSSAHYSANNGQNYDQNLPIYSQSSHYSAAVAGVDTKAPPNNEYTSNPAIASNE